MKRVSLADVARAAGVGKATASRALSGNEEVGMATRARILDIAESMGYQPNRTAQSLRTGRFNVVALFVPLSEPWVGEVIRDCAITASAAGHQLLIQDSAGLEAMTSPAAYLRSLAADGLCVVGASHRVADALTTTPVIPTLTLLTGDDEATPTAQVIDQAVARICSDDAHRPA
ncbi:LacI family DNA-binding transcriptional regulator [Rudaeicoccus suwonensis]|uniref:Regulatory LacI family protein n=1 Tax=Rudaeicoccus suwonensis TaxID=657409 RepID=A0A561E3T0_9MICO|nr:LacI family DNA-binding transcriptional regulator [Rudaeicoccus suwonensis]TWE10272.1 regulatory LacI family protein [Rudaeicoccus suwonensis]